MDLTKPTFTHHLYGGNCVYHIETKHAEAFRKTLAKLKKSNYVVDAPISPLSVQDWMGVYYLTEEKRVPLLTDFAGICEEFRKML